VSSLAFGADGTLMSTGQGLRTSTGVVSDATEWKVGISSLLQAACDRANRELSPDEWNVLVGSAVRYRPVCAQFR
jgi:hypothetical protein